jgi:gliding motility-associated-like protein
MRKILLIFLLNLLIIHSFKSQTNTLNVVSSAGTFSNFSNGSMAWTIGEVTIDTYSYEAYFLTQGFHQPSNKTIIKDIEFFIPEGFSPNKDLSNDVFFIRGLSKYPNNSIEIYNRWGNKVFEASPYNNNWDGKNQFGLTIGEDDLPVGTYFYLFDFGNGANIIKGTIYLNK